MAREAPELDRQICSLRDRVEMPDTLASLPGLLARTTEGLKRIRQIVNDLRLFARLDEGEVNEADLNAGIQSTATIIQGHAKDEGRRPQARARAPAAASPATRPGSIRW